MYRIGKSISIVAILILVDWGMLFSYLHVDKENYSYVTFIRKNQAL